MGLRALGAPLLFRILKPEAWSFRAKRPAPAGRYNVHLFKSATTENAEVTEDTEIKLFAVTSYVDSVNSVVVLWL